MAERGAGRLRRLLGRGASEPPAPGTRRRLPAWEALARLEESASDVACRLRAGSTAAHRAALEGESRERRGGFRWSSAEEPSAVVAEASGLALAGLRATAFLEADALGEVREQLAGAALRRTPLVVHAAFPDEPSRGGGTELGHAPLHAVADTGAFLLVARDPQHALDLALVARRLAEQGLLPGVLSLDGRETARALRDVAIPEEELLRSFLGEPGDQVDSPTPAQVLLFGDRRRRVPRWFDPDLAAAVGVPPHRGELAAAAAGRRRFFGDPVAALAREAMTELAALTGRPLDVVTRHRLEDAEHVVVAMGSSVELAAAVADRLREQRRRVGVLGITLLRPFPAEEVRSVLGHARTVSVLERVAEPLEAAPPLMREIRATGILGPAAEEPDDEASGVKPRGRAGRPVRAARRAKAPSRPERLAISGVHGLGGQGVTAELLEACFRNAEEDAPRRSFHLGVGAPTGTSSLPKRQALLQRLQREHPGLAREALSADVRTLEVRGEEATTLTLTAFRQDPDELLRRLAEALPRERHVTGRLLPAAEDVTDLALTLAGAPVADPGDRPVADVAAVVGLAGPEGVRPAARVRRGGALLVSTALPAADLWRALPAAWRDDVRGGELCLLLCDEGVDAALSHAAALTEALAESGRTRPSASEVARGVEGVDEVDWRALGEPERETGLRHELPLAVRRHGRTGETWDVVSRFFSEVVQPRLLGETESGPIAAGGGERAPVPDPYMALGAVPAATATFHDMTPERLTVPWIDAATCIGCGDCWTACPDSALAPSALPLASLLDAAAAEVDREAPGPPDEAAARLRRAHPQLAAKTESLIVREKAESLEARHVREAFEWLAGKLDVSEEERPTMEAALERTLAASSRLALAVTDPFFRAPRSEKAQGELLALAVNPQACQGCGGCAAVCPVEAIRIVPQTEAALTHLRGAWSAFESLPETSGRTIARVAGREDVGEIAAILSSRAALFAVAGGDGGEPGSGDRLATRLVAAVMEVRSQRALVEHLRVLDELESSLSERVKQLLASAVETDDMAALERALSDDSATDVGRLAEHLKEQGVEQGLDAAAARERVRLARSLGRTRVRLAEGATGLGRARFGWVVAGERTASWAASFPRNPFSVPVVADLTGSGADLARGVLQGLLSRRLDELRDVRRARLLVDSPPDVARQLEELASLEWGNLNPAERATCPPLVVLTAREDVDADGLSRLLSGELPVKVLVLEDPDPSARRPDLALLALAHREAFVLSSSPSHPDHLAEGVEAALDFPGPALLRVVAPSPRGEGFATSATVARARDAVRSRLVPLLRFDPRARESGHALRLDGNPDPGATWALDEQGRPVTPADWTLGAARLRSALLLPSSASSRVSASKTTPVGEWTELPESERRGQRPVLRTAEGEELLVAGELARAVVEARDRWTALQEASGLVSRFSEDVAVRARREAEKERDDGLARLEAEHGESLDHARQEQRLRDVELLTARLMQLAGCGGSDGPSRDARRGVAPGGDGS